ncbi:hypothetical protein ZIOFF_017438 [Zingiber officinale]|uniref:Uncharacterized protein n=1 Tax=Zingiber officinale TaxID=94328 RepID=A0A8J5H4Z3_ZINOF|nr:hypothetical protein ZIOFF_017438 [Zingiber officinale]
MAAAAAPGGTSPSNLRFPSPNSFSLRPFAPPSTVRFLGPSLLPRRLRISLLSPARRSIADRSGRSGGFGDGGNGGSGGGGGDGGESGESGNNNRSEALLALAKAERALESLPKDLAAAIENGRIPGLIVQRFFELERSSVFRWLLQFGGFKERLLADDLFLAKLAMECGVGIFAKVFNSILWEIIRALDTAAEWERRRENFVKELDFVICDVNDSTSQLCGQELSALLCHQQPRTFCSTLSSAAKNFLLYSVISSQELSALLCHQQPTSA